jgi:uncharacterized protein (TIGR04255 family)
MTEYPHPPILEAVIELRYGGAGSDKAFEQATKRVRRNYPVAQDVWAKKLTAEGITSEGPDQVFIARHLASQDGADTAILHPDRVGLSRKTPYLGWDELKMRFGALLSAAKAIGKGRTLVRIGVRYIDRVDVPTSADTVFDYQEFVKIAPSPLPFEAGPITGDRRRGWKVRRGVEPGHGSVAGSRSGWIDARH